jgi:phage terminase large subunit
MGSINQVDSTVGRSYDLIIFDEAALADGMEAFNVALRPTLDKDNAKALFISTPRGRNNWFANLFDRGFSDQFPEWCSIQADYLENPRMSAVDIEEARNSMSEAEFRQEYHADFNTYEGQIWNFDFENDVEDLSELDISKMDVFSGLDVGYRDPTALATFAYDWDSRIFYLISEYYNSEKTTEKHAEEIRDRVDRYDMDYIYIDSAAQQTRFDFAQQYDISTINAKKSVLDGIAYVANLVDNHRLIVDQRCENALLALDQYQWDPNPNLIREKPKHNIASNMADAIRYGLYSFETTMTGF